MLDAMDVQMFGFGIPAIIADFTSATPMLA
jgi:hypothetical protein